MKKFYLAPFLVLCIIVKAQNNVGIGTQNPNPNSILELFSNNKGLLIPRLTNAEMLAIPVAGSVDRGIMIFNTIENNFYYYNGLNWVPVNTDNQVLSYSWNNSLDTLLLTVSNNGNTIRIPFNNIGNQGVTGVTGATGANGINGSNGVTGATGANGINGSNGITGATGANGANGINGVTGATGNGINTIIDNGDGTITINNTNGTTTIITLPNGVTGSTGLQGISCWDANQNGIGDLPSEDLNSDGVVDFRDCNAGSGSVGPIGVTGATGANGINGSNGITGATGANGANGINGVTGATGNGINTIIDNGDGTITINNTNGTTTIITLPNGVTGSTGLQGISCWDANQNGIGDLPSEDLNSDGVVDFRDCNAGSGSVGPIGVTGATGANGINGSNGITGATGANGTNGINGVTGATGNGINTIIDNGDGTITINNTNGTTTIITLPNGVTGSTGLQGISCWDANQNGIGDLPSEDLNSDGVVDFRDCNAGSGSVGPIGVTGATGANGINGSNGITGATGANGANGINGVTGATGNGINTIIDNGDGTITINNTNGTTTIITLPNGVTGSTGLQGISCWDANQNGIGDLPSEDLNSDGVVDFRDCNAGSGSVGPIGVTGATGANGINGSNGITGATGANGANGINGVTGATGNGINTIIDNGDGTITINNTNGTTTIITLPNGVTGSTGLQGISCWDANQNGIGDLPSEDLNSDGVVNFRDCNAGSGSVGPIGVTGATGANGINGSNGITGATGANGINGSNGITGATGADGINGSNGITGATGANGINGSNGITGATGANGANGINGVTGATGNGINTIIDNGDGTITINNTNGTTTIITLPNGVTGSTGLQGISCWDANQNGIGDLPSEDLNSDGVVDFRDCNAGSGSVGPIGVTGATGANGINGSNGITGATGANGINGSNGITGATGADGINGSNGITGATGANGINGSNGITGATGANGINGSNGITGATGANGINGSNGITGATGANGTNGINGSNGITGATGADGANGINGSNGITGATGANGANGINGSNGITGATGADGINGSNGITGATGANGANGINGSNGITGATGANGANGLVGPTGIVGTTGADAPNTDWHLLGNSGTDLSLNFIGTTDNVDLRISTSSNERIRVLSSGNVGVGTSVAPARLTVFNTFSSPTIPNATTNAILRIGENTEGLDIGKAGGTSNFASWLQSGFNGSADPLSLQPLGGNVGIGTTNPSLAKFQVDGMVGNTISLFRGNSTTSQGISMIADWPGIYFNSYYNGGVRSMSNSGFTSIINTDQSVGGLLFQTTNIANPASGTVMGSIPVRMTIAGNGNVGIGANTPTNRLHVENTTPGALRIVDGTEASNYVLTSDATGVGTWQPAAITNIIGTLGAGVHIPNTTSNYLQTGTTITLPSGRWAVNIVMLLKRTDPGGSVTTTPANSNFWLRSTLSNSSAANPLPSPDIIGSSNLISGNYPGSSRYSILQGTIFINNTSGANRTYYYVAGRVESDNTSDVLLWFGGNWWLEDQIYALRISN